MVKKSHTGLFSVSKEQLMHGLQLVHSKLCKNVTGSTGLHCTSSRSDHTHRNNYTNIFQMTKEVALT